ncbi:unnamed protein product [Rotaria socialis]
MNNLLESNFEYLPDEMILEIYRYLHCGHVLYSFYNLNSRFNSTITNYCHHVILRRLNYNQFLHIYSNVLPNIGSSIISLTINRLQQTYFFINFSFRMSKIFPNLKKLALDDWKSEILFSFIENHLSQLKYLRTIIIRGLQSTICKNSIADTNDDYKHLLEITHRNTQIESIYFEPDCYSMILSINQKDLLTHSNLIEMSISLTTSNDLISLAMLVPNIRRLHVIIEEFSPINKTIIPFRCLTDFSLDAIDFYSKLDDISSILQLTPTIQNLSLALATLDECLIYGQHLFRLLSSQLFISNNLIQKLKYAVYFSASAGYCLDSENLLTSWNPIPIGYTINETENRSFILLHTLPYPSILLNLHSTLANTFGINMSDHVYNNIQYLCISNAKTLLETFTIIRHCRKIQDLNIQIENHRTVLPVPTNKQVNINLPKLKHLEILSILGTVDNWQHFEALLISAHTISTLRIDLNCAIKLFESTGEDLIFSRVLHLFIDGHSSDLNLKNAHINSLSKVFSGIHSLKIKHTTDHLIEPNIVGSLLDNCKQLIVFTINGRIPDGLSLENIQEWLIEYSSRLKNSEKNYQMSFTFGATPATKTIIFGTPTNTNTATAPTASPFTFGTPAATTTTSTAPLFGVPAATTTATTAPFNFATPAATTTTSIFGFGSPASTTTAATTAAKTLFTGFGTGAPTTTTGFGFGAPTTTSAPAAFGGFGFPAAPVTTTAPAFAFSGGQPFGTNTAPAQIAAPPANAIRPDDLLITSLTAPRLFNDERDELLLKWNILQVFYGTGKTFCHLGVYDVDVNLPYHVFKTYSYSVRPKTRDEDGLVALIINQKLADVVKDKDKRIESLHRLCFNNNPNCIIELEGISPLADDRTQMLIVVSEKQPGTLLVKKAKASVVVNYLQPPPQQQQATTLMAPPANPNKAHLDSMGIVQVFARTDLSDQDYKQYLDSTPPGLTAFVWEQAKKENPKPQLLLPVPLVGVKALRDRMKSQFIEHEDQKQQLEIIRQQLHSVKDQCDAFRLTMKRYQTNLLEYSHRILKATIQFECRRRQYEPKLTSTEIQIWTNLHSLQSLSQSPLDIRIKDLIMKIRMNPTLLAPIQWASILNTNESLRFDKEKIEQIKDILQDIHRGIKNVVELVQNDRTALAKIDEKLSPRR